MSFLIPTGRIGGFQVEGLFHQKGAQHLLRLDDKLRLTYLEVPVLLHIDVYQRDPRAVYVIAGPTLAFNIQALYESDGEREDVMDGIEEPAFDETERDPAHPLSWSGNFHEFPPVLVARLRRV